MKREKIVVERDIIVSEDRADLFTEVRCRAEQADRMPTREEFGAELDRLRADALANPQNGVSWEQLKSRLASNGGYAVTVAEAISTIRRLNPADRARAVQEIMESFIDEEPLTDAEREHLDRALAADNLDPTAGRSWEEVEADMIAREERDGR